MESTFDGFTERAQRAIQFARAEAKRFHHTYIGTEHLIIGILREGDGNATEVLSRHGIDLTVMREALDKWIGSGSGDTDNEVTMNYDAQHVIDRLRHLNYPYIDTRTLLWGILQQGESLGAIILSNFGLRAFTQPSYSIRALAESGPLPGVRLSPPSQSPNLISTRFSLLCRNLIGMRSFYTSELGGVVDSGRSTPRIVALWLAGPSLVLLHDDAEERKTRLPFPTAVEINLLAGNIDVLWNSYKDRGIGTLSAISETLSDYSFTLLDPEGHTLRFFQSRGL